MKDEIKEILNEIKILNGNVELGYEKSQILLDYITNLQKALLDIKEYIEHCLENTPIGEERTDSDDVLDNEYKYILSKVNKALGEDNE